MADNVKVAVRVRPFNAREKERDATCIIKMDGTTTSITSPETGEVKNFAFDYSYWSHTPGPNFADQKVVFDDLGIGVLENAWQGYNVSLFAYGQTGAGKSYSMVGYGEDKGIIPCACQELFNRIESNENPDITYRVQASMMEIYNEKVRDLFNPGNKANDGAGLKVRDNPKTGPYVEGLALLPVKNYSQIEHLMDEGTKARTVASTQMNATSSRAHTLFTIMLTQTKVDKAAGKAMDKVSKISLVDLAGSERASGTGATGDRLKEGAAINKSLSALGNVISALADSGSGKPGAPKKVIPYRDSVLTWLLKESLGGNAKTIMIAALSPADINYDETLSTLRYADRAKQIKNVAVVNEDPNQKMIRELKEEVERLRQLAQGQGQPEVDLETLTAQARRDAEAEAARKFAEYEEELAQSRKLLEELNKSWEEKERDAADIEKQRHVAMVEMGLAVSDEDMAHPQLININEDPNRSGAIIYALKPGTTTVGRPDAEVPQAIKLVGLNMSKEHCVITNDMATGVVSISRRGGRTWVNGELLQDLEERLGTVVLEHNARVRFGNNHLFRFYDGKADERRQAELRAAEDAGSPLPPDPVIDWEFAQLELATAAGAAGLMVQSEDEIKAAEEMRKKMEETEKLLLKEKQEVQQQLHAQEEELKRRDEQLQKLVGQERELAQRKLEEEQTAMQKKQEALEQELARRIAEAEAAKAAQARKRRDNELLHDYLVAMMPLIQEANMVSEELDKQCHFELKIVHDNAIQGQGRIKKSSLADDGEAATGTSVAVLVVDSLLNKSRIWSRQKFHDRIFAIRDYYHKAMLRMSGADDEDGEIEDPFQDDSQGGVILGHTHIYLESLWWLLPIEITSPVIDYKGKSEGKLSVAISITAPDGQELCKDGVPGDSVEHFMGERALVTVEVREAVGLPSHLCDYYVQFMDFSNELRRTAPSDNRAQQRRFDFRQQLDVLIDKELEEKLLSETISFQVWGAEASQRPATSVPGQRHNRRGQGLGASQLSEKERELAEREAELEARQAAWEKELLRPMTGAAHLGDRGSSSADVFSLEEEEPDDTMESPSHKSRSADRLELIDDDEEHDIVEHSSVVRFQVPSQAHEEEADRLRRENEELAMRLREAEEMRAAAAAAAAASTNAAAASANAAGEMSDNHVAAEIEEQLAREKMEKDALMVQLEQFKEQQRKEKEEMEEKLRLLENAQAKPSAKSKACILM